jgi:ABC-2 type transport system ATP-binding protein
MSVLIVDNAVKRFGKFTAVDHVSFEVEKGSIHGILGPNGAGKTTTIRMINNILDPDEGSITVFGEKIKADHQNRMGYLPEERGLYKKIKVLDQLVYFGQLKGLKKADAAKRAKYWLEKFNALDWAPKKIGELSKGMQQKIQFISTILHDPELLILDEPFSGFDPINTESLKDTILELKDRGITIMLSTHVMHQVEQMCDTICMINQGKKVLDGSVREIKKAQGKDTILLEFDGDRDFLNDIPGVKFINKSKNRAEFRIIDNKINPKDIIAMINEKTEIIKYELMEPSINEIFIKVVEGMEVPNVK